MKDIYEILNDAEMNVEEYEDQKLSDYENKAVKQQISREIKKMKNKRKIWKVSVAAACMYMVIGGYSISAAAGLLPIPEIFKTMFGIDSKEKIEVANDLGSSINVSDEAEGYRITAEGVLADSKNMCIVYKIEKSDGSSLSEKGEICTNAEFLHFNGGSYWSHGSAGVVEQEHNAYSIEYYTSFTFIENLYGKEKITLRDMKLWFGDEVVEVSGSWEFEIPLETEDCSVDLADGQKIKCGKHEGKIEELMFSPIGYSLKVTSSEELSANELIKTVDGLTKLYLKDGKEIELHGGSYVTDNRDGTWSFVLEGTFDNLILPEDMEKVIIGDREFKF